MFGILNDTVQLQGTNVVLPSSALAVGTSSAAATLHVQQGGTAPASGLMLEGPDAHVFTMHYNGTGLAITDSLTTPCAVFQSGGNVGLGVANPSANLHVGGDVRVDGDLTVNGSVTTINSVTTITHMIDVTNNG